MPKAESEEELKSFLMRVKESERAGLRLNIKKKKKTRAWHPVPLLHGKYMKVVMISSSWAPKSQWTLTVAMKSEEIASWQENLDSVLKTRDITLLTKVQLVYAMSLHSLYIVLVKAVVFPLVMYGCDSWTIKNVGCQRIDAFELWCWKRLLEVP